MADVDGELKRLAEQRIASGELPCPPASRTWGSHGSGAPCSLCARPIQTHEIEYEVAPVDLRGAADPRTVRFHLRCHAVWQAQCHHKAHVRV
ncbi:MAG TPA: hypothetical protein VMF64_04170 [Steroidobacteraceae bacterium]|nr:hypothetical protein [Steroidobacteraceae bacterium]